MAELTDAMIDEAIRRGEEERASGPIPVAVRYDASSGRIVIDFENGTVFMVPARSLQDLEEASDDDLSEVELELGYALRWERLDVDFTIKGLMAGIFGTTKFMEARRRSEGDPPIGQAGSPSHGGGTGHPRRSPAP